MHSVLGVWSLIDWQRIYADGKRVYPFGENPVGLLAYMPDGRMMVQMLTRTRPLIDSPDPVGGSVNERAQAYSTCLAYFGTYKVLDNEVEHHIEASLYPNWTGKTTARGTAIEDGKLILRTDPSVVDGVSVVNEMSWERMGIAHHQACSPGLTQQQTGNIYMVKPPSSGLGPTIGSTAARAKPLSASHQSDLDSLAPYMLMLMMRNVTSDGFVVEDPSSPGVYSLPGCIIAAPSFPANTPGVDQDYVYNWVRDAAITAIEIAAADLPTSGGSVQTLIDYVNFAATCYNNAVLSSQNNGITKGHACFTIAGKVRPWTEQSDGPALQTIAILRAYDQLDEVTKRTAIDLIEKNLAYLLSVYREPTTNLWEEHTGDSFFARSVQLRCFREIAESKIGIAVPNAVAEAITWLDNALAKHWNGAYYVSLAVPGSQPPQSVTDGYDANIDIVSACVYGAIPCTDPKLLATVAVLRQQWSDPRSASVYPINLADKERGIGPLFGRYPKDIYDGDVAAPVLGGHPWALCTANVAEIYYKLARAITSANKVPFDDVSKTFFEPLGIQATTKADTAVTMLRHAADAMLRAILFHSDRYELSEQFDGTSGYEKSVHNLTWSYATFLSALRARNA